MPVVTPPQFSAVTDEVPMDGEALAARLTPIASGQVASYNFDSLVLFERFIDHLEALRRERPEVTPLEALESFAFDSLASLRRDGSTYCIGLARQLVETLRGEGWPCYLCASSLGEEFREPGLPAFSHAAAILRFRSPIRTDDAGLVLFDPGYNFAFPIVLRPGGSALTGNPEHPSRFELNPEGTEVTAFLSKAFRFGRLAYRTDRWVNADEHLSRGFVRAAALARLVARDAAGRVVASLSLRFDQGLLRLKVGAHVLELELEDRAAWSACITPAFAALFRTDQARLLERLERVIAHLDDLRALRS